MAAHIPLELKMKIVEELHISNDKLSSVSFLWPETISLIRDYRFKDIRIGAAGPSHIPLSVEKLLLIISGAPEIAGIVRTLSFVPFSYPAKMKSVHFELDTDEFEDNDGCFEGRMYYVYSSPNLVHLLSLTTALESIRCNGLFLTMLPSFHHVRLFEALASLPCVRTYTIHKFLAEKLSHLDDLLHSLPHLTTLAVSSFAVVELHHMLYTGPFDGDHFWTGDDIQLLDWLDPDYETPEVKFGPFENIVSLDLSYETPSGCIFVDMIPVVPLCPFPNLQKLVFNFEYLSERSYFRLYLRFICL